MLSGFVEANGEYGAYLFYLLSESLSSPSTDPIVLWLNVTFLQSHFSKHEKGGPGTSSMFGAFVENGPYIIQTNGTFYENPFTWTNQATMIWMDNPGTPSIQSLLVASNVPFHFIGMN